MQILQLTIPSLIDPILSSIKIPQANIINNSIIDQRVPVDRDLYVEIFGGVVGIVGFEWVGDVVFLHDFEDGEFFQL